MAENASSSESMDESRMILGAKRESATHSSAEDKRRRIEDISAPKRDGLRISIKVVGIADRLSEAASSHTMQMRQNDRTRIRFGGSW